MSVFRKLSLIWLFLGICLIPERIRAAEISLKKAQTENFELVGNASDEKFREIAGKLESFKAEFFGLFALEKTAPRVAENVLIFDSEGDCRNYFPAKKERGLQNSFVEGADANYFLICLDQHQKADLRKIYHDYSHYLIKNQVGKNKIPVWLNEGISKILEKFDAGEPLENAAKNFDNLQTDYVSPDKLLPRNLFLENDYYAFGQQETHDSGVFPTQSALFVAFLLNQKSRTDFQSFIKLFAEGVTASDAFAKVYQTDYARIEKSLNDFIAVNSAAKIQKTSKPSPFANAKLDFQKLSEADLAAFIGDFYYQSNDLRNAELYALKSLAADPANVFAAGTFGLIKAREFKFDEAFAVLEKSVSAPRADFLNYYRYAYALSRQGMTEYNFVSNYELATAEKIRELLREAIERNPDFAESYNLFSLVNYVRNEDLDASLAFVEKILRQSPGNEWYVLRKSEIEMRRENFAEARRNARNVYFTTASAGIKLYAQNTLQRIDATEYQLLAAKRDKNLPYSEAISEKPFTDEEIARLRARALLESLNAALRKPAPDEERILGSVVGIECRPNQINFTIRADKELLKLRTDSFETLRLTNYNETTDKPQSAAEI